MFRHDNAIFRDYITTKRKTIYGKMVYICEIHNLQWTMQLITVLIRIKMLIFCYTMDIYVQYVIQKDM
jgi:hypothetical protein